MALYITIVLSFTGIVLTLLYPLYGLLLTIFLVYFPIFSTFDLGPVTISVSTLPVLALFARAFFPWLQNPRRAPFPAWQGVILAGMALAYTLATVASSNVPQSLALLPNLIMYAMILFSVIVLVRRPEDFLLITKVILLMVLVDALVPGLAPIRRFLGTGGLGINGIAIKYYPAFTIGLVYLTQPVPGVSKPWRLIGGVTAVLAVVRVILFQTRSAWLAMIFILLALTVLLPRRLVLLGIVALCALAAAYFYRDIIQRNIVQTQGVLTALQEGSYDDASSDDRIRLVSREFGWRLAQERPVLGWGPDTFGPMIKQYAPASRKYVTGGAFNSWLMLLDETGAFGVVWALAAFCIPAAVSVFIFPRLRGSMRYISLAIALGVLGTGVHLYFIDLMYTTQVWLHVGLAIAALNCATQAVKAKEPARRRRGVPLWRVS